MALLFYTSILSALVAIAHAIYGVSALRRRQWMALGLAELAALGLFAPWLIVIWEKLGRLREVTAWTTAGSLQLIQLKLWGLHFASVFIDPALPLDHVYTNTVPLLVLGLIGFSLYRCWREFPHRTSFFLLALTAVPAIALMGGDLLRGSILSIHTRYFMPALVGAELAVAGWLGGGYAQTHPKLCRVILGSLLVIGLINGLVIVNAPTWWSKVTSYANHAIAEVVNAAEHPIILAQNNGVTLGNLISLSYRVPPQTEFVVTSPPTIPQPPEPNFQTLLLYDPAEKLTSAYGCPARKLPVPGNLWQVTCP